MPLTQRTAVIYGGGGAIGGAVARKLAARGATVCLAGRHRGPLDRVASLVRDSGGHAVVDELDVLDRAAVNAHAAALVEQTGRLDIAVVAVGFAHVQGTPFTELSLADFESPISEYMRAYFNITQTVSGPMLAQRSGVIITISTPGSRLPGTGHIGFGVTCAAIEAMTRHLAGELGPHGVRTVCLRPDAIPEAVAAGSHARSVFAPMAHAAGMDVDSFVATAGTRTLTGVLPTLDQVAETAAFVASDAGGALTGAVVNLTCGSLVD